MELFVAIGATIAALLIGAALGWLLGRRTAEGASAQAAALDREVALLKEERKTLQSERDGFAARLSATGSQLAATQEREKSLREALARQEAALAEIHNKNRFEFESISTKLLNQATGTLAASSESQMQNIINPLKERLGEFQSRMDAAFAKDANDTISLKAQIEQAMKVSTSVGEKADSLAKALRGDVRASGRWGELVLERILELSLLEENREFVRQGIGMGMQNEEGDRLKPDVLIRLPGEKCVVIDSKLPLKHYDSYCSAGTDREKTDARAAFVAAVEGHIQSLSRKQYQDNNKVVVHDLVLMFIPVEGAVSLALLNERDLVEKAWRQQIVLVGPSSLLMTLKTVATIWKVQKQADNQELIAKAGAVLYKQLRNFVDSLTEVGHGLETASAAYEKALKRLSTGKRNAIRTARRLAQLGVKADQPIPDVDDGISDIDDQDPLEDSDDGDDTDDPPTNNPPPGSPPGPPV